MGVGPSCGISACWFINWPLHMESKERPKKDTDHSRWVSSSLNEQGNLYRILVLGGLKMRRSPQLPAKILSLFGNLNWAQSCIQSRWPQHHTAPQVCILETGSSSGSGGQNAHAKDKGRGEETLIAWVQLKGHRLSLSTCTQKEQV